MTGQRSIANQAHKLIEEHSLYVFLAESAAQLGAPLVRVADGRNPFEVYCATRFLV